MPIALVPCSKMLKPAADNGSSGQQPRERPTPRAFIQRNLLAFASFLLSVKKIAGWDVLSICELGPENGMLKRSRVSTVVATRGVNGEGVGVCW